MLVKDIMQCFPNETGELLHVVEFIVYNTPGPHGYTPRDIDRRWSMATPLDKELQPFMVNQFEPISDYLKTLFRNYREIRVRVLGWLKDSSAKRADLANRFRRLKNIQPGDEVQPAREKCIDFKCYLSRIHQEFVRPVCRVVELQYNGPIEKSDIPGEEELIKQNDAGEQQGELR